MNSSIKTYISKWTFMLLLMALISSCGNDEIKPEEQLIGQWKLDFTVMGNAIELSPMGGVLYEFEPHHTFIRTSAFYRDEGTYVYKKSSRTLSLNYKTYGIQVSDPRSLDLQIEKISNKELIFKVEYNDTTWMGEFVEYKFIHYSKK